MKWRSALDEVLLSRVEDASLNASAPPQQRWLDGWLVRYSPGKAKRARCVIALAAARQPLEDRLRQARAIYAEAGLPALVRITPFTHPSDLDAWLAERGWTLLDDTRVMVCTRLQRLQPGAPAALPAGSAWEPLAETAYAQAVGELRGSPPEQCLAHAQRLLASPVPYRGYAIRRVGDGTILACGQYAREANLVGLYDVHTHPQVRGQGLATVLCKRLLSLSAGEGAEVAYLQVDASNDPARRIYQRLGFVDGYAYHYRQAP